MNRSTAIAAGVLAIALCATVGMVATTTAGPEKWASIKTTAVCSLSGSDLTVAVGWVAVKENTPDPVISREVITLEQRVNNVWIQSGILFDGAFAGNPHNHTFPVAIQPGAKSLRATVTLTVDNANPRRPGGTQHPASCDSPIVSAIE